MKTTTEINATTIKQRLNMLTNPPAAPVMGRGNARVELTSDETIVNELIYRKHPHIAVVSVRQAINRFGKIGYPKVVFCSPEFMALFN